MLARVIVAIVLTLLPTAALAQAEKRFALLIGNQAYGAKIGALKNPHADIALVAEALRSLAFKVTEIKDADYKAVDIGIKRHIQTVRREGEGTISLLYYSGHGAADPDTKINYLIPVDVTSADDESLWISSLNLNNVIENLREQAPAATHYVVFDACRNELNLTRKGQKALSEKGFVPLAFTPGVMIAYATAPGRTASDTGIGSGPYAKALSEEIVKPGAEALYMFRRVALRVNREIGQDPWISASTLPEVYFAGKKPEGPTPEQQMEMAFWASVKDNNDPAVLKTYLERYPSGAFAAIATALVDQQEQRLKAEVAARDEERKRAEEARKAAELQRKEEERRAREALLAEERRRAEEKRNSSEVTRLEQQQRAEALAQAEELRKAYAELQAARAAAKAAEEQRVAAIKAAEAAQQTAKVALATQPDLKPGIRPPVHLDVQAGGFFAEKDAKRVASLGEKYRFPIPDFRIDVPGNDVQSSLRGFVGIWLDGEGKGRTHLIIVTRVHQDGSADGFFSSGPPTPTSFDQGPPGVFIIAGRISGDTLRFTNPKGTVQFRFTLTNAKQLQFFYSNSKGQTTTRMFDPVWTLVDAERSGKR
jgi:uncharacterized caspase-like protein